MTQLELSVLICKKGINSKYFNWMAEGDIYDLNDKTIRDYPAGLVTFTGPHTFLPMTTRFRLSIFYFDRLAADDSNSSYIYSTAVEVLKNLINDLRHDEHILKVSEEIQIMPFIAPEAQGLSDRCCGAYATLDITIKNDTTCFLS